MHEAYLKDMKIIDERLTKLEKITKLLYNIIKEYHTVCKQFTRKKSQKG